MKCRDMRAERTRSAIVFAAVTAAVVAAAVGPTPADAGFIQPLIDCTYDPATKVVTLDYGDPAAPDPSFELPAVSIIRKGKLLRFEEVNSGEIDPRSCTGGTPTVENTDRIDLRRVADPILGTLTFLDFSGGPLGPGATGEPGGSEIEIDANLGEDAEFDFDNTDGPDRITFGSSGGQTLINFNPAEKSPDADLTIHSDSDLFIDGSPGNDRLVADGGAGTGRALQTSIGLIGGAGNDTLTGGAGGDYFQGDRGDDTIRGLGGSDRIDVYGGEGADHLFCGSGDDHAGVDKHDHARGCEHTGKPHA